jgi:hypothetical protein
MAVGGSRGSGKMKSQSEIGGRAMLACQELHIAAVLPTLPGSGRTDPPWSTPTGASSMAQEKLSPDTTAAADGIDASGEIAARKAAVLDLIDAAGTDGSFDEEPFEQLMEALKSLCAITPTPRPLDRQEFVAGPWRTLFASFGPRHTAGKTLVHETLLSYQSFNKFPKVPVRVIQLEQEIHAGTHEYNNIAYLESLDGSARASVITRGSYSDTDENRQRYLVSFHRVELVSDDGRDDEALRAAFGLPEDHPLAVDLKGDFHSDVAFCDDDMRVNYGSVGGVYVLERLHHDGRSVDFTRG